MFIITQNVRSLVEKITLELEPWYESRMHAQRVAWWLLEKLTQKTMSQLVTTDTISLTHKDHALLTSWITAHTKEYYPLQYILGTVPFGNLSLCVEPPTLIPRPETEEWCINLLKNMLLHLPKETPLHILDLCTGSGCIALLCAQSFPAATVWALDIADTALQLAKKNAERNNITNVRFLKSDLFNQLNKDILFDIIISNPPYIASSVWHELSQTITRWEDRGALVADNNGLALIIHIVNHATKYLKKDSLLKKYGLPRLALEIGYDQKKYVEELFIHAGFNGVKTISDSYDRDRLVIGL